MANTGYRNLLPQRLLEISLAQNNSIGGAVSVRKTTARYVVIYSAFHVGLAFNFLTPLAYVKIKQNAGDTHDDHRPVFIDL